MSVDVTNQKDFPILLELLNQHLGMIDAWVQLLVRLNPLAIQVHTSKIASGVSIYDSVRVKHRDDLKDKVVSKYSGS